MADCTVAAGGDGCQPWRILQCTPHTSISMSKFSSSSNQPATHAANIRSTAAAGSFPHSNSLAAAAAAARFLVACMHYCIEYAAALEQQQRCRSIRSPIAGLTQEDSEIDRSIHRRPAGRRRPVQTSWVLAVAVAG
uniref:Uncharacterized protein n=1 Tax=Oryza meridionalis TaxID=40149 RepID=A0A0E0F2Q7_9ORYZ